MPIYEFVCEDCGHHFERIQSFSDTTVPVCPVCASENVVRQVSRPAIHFKGSGWYITDSKDSGKKPASDAANGSAKSDDSKGSDDSKAKEKESDSGAAEASSKADDKAESKSGTSDKPKAAPAPAD